jgi:ElaB/YqjD/DUF883 family membrane-anchored ribosome-binding protein
VGTESQELLKATAGAVGEKASAIRDRLSDALETAKDNCRELQEKAIESAEATDKVIRKHPYQSLGIAFGVGVLIGVLVGRR